MSESLQTFSISFRHFKLRLRFAISGDLLSFVAWPSFVLTIFILTYAILVLCFLIFRTFKLDEINL